MRNLFHPGELEGDRLPFPTIEMDVEIHIDDQVHVESAWATFNWKPPGPLPPEDAIALVRDIFTSRCWHYLGRHDRDGKYVLTFVSRKPTAHERAAWQLRQSAA